MACAGSPTGPTTSLRTEFTLAPADVMRVDGTSLTVRFNDVSRDSRCPADALCIQLGASTISLVQLMPYPFSSRKIPPDEYRATLKVTR